MHEFITKLYNLALSSHIVSTLLEPVHIIILALPFVTLLVAMIILAVQLRTKDALTERNLISTYSFIWYIAAAYLLIILPLPTRSSVAKLTTAEYNLQPFYFIEQLKLLTPFKVSEPSTWLAAFKSSTFFQPFFNVLLFMPIGAYLKWRHHWPLWLITLTSFTLSLFFETTQLTGLYGYYSRAYRMFDVDDLMMNTLGGIVGAWALIFIPKKWRNTDHSTVLQHADHPINWRRVFALAIDWIVIAAFDVIYFVLVKHFNWPLTHNYVWLYVTDIVLFFWLPAICLHGKTLGGILMNSQMVSTDGRPANPLQITIHYAGLYLVSLPLLFLDLWLFNRLGNMPSASLNRLDVYLVIVSLILLIISYDLLLAFFSRQHQLWCERLSRTLVK
ncbi:VanZ family protein [Lactiplantibacillus fabifermentans]|uniref:Integral membrane protein n=2 Tax=Lactiplantibacillus fabifermentans TaxID=483011 RepID=A0A0R2NU19_9LACO|nr:VanZ family protein [Lactiplantibacillus fabifermentans]ETY73652.1 membrane protein [Lactiplantibacillus fabifermentans T30PCM01]KRO29169.1 integral membrane protein [Lactiplantibacillus fabifermentans DSM 21115]